MTGPTRADGEPSLSYLEPTQILPWVKPAPRGVEWMLGVGRGNQWGLVKGMRQEVLVVYLSPRCTNARAEASSKMMFSFFRRRYLASRHHVDSHHPLCLLSGGFVQNLPQENSRYLVCFLSAVGGEKIKGKKKKQYASNYSKISGGFLDYYNHRCCSSLTGNLVFQSILPKVGK